MRYLKRFEELEEHPKIGDYVIVYADYFDNALIDFFKEEVGRLIEFKDDGSEYAYIIKFNKNIPHVNTDGIEYIDKSIYEPRIMEFDKHEIIEWSSDKDYLIAKIASNKYNL